MIKTQLSIKTQITLCAILSFFFFLFSNGEWCIPMFTWIYPVLFLYLCSVCRSRKVLLLLFVIYAAGFLIQFTAVIGMGVWFCAAAAVLVSAAKLLPYWLWQKSGNTFLSAISFAAAMVLVEYAFYLIYPILGGLSDAYTQYQNLYLLQLTTVTGIYGVTFLTYWTAAVLLCFYHHKKQPRTVKKYIFIYCSVMGLVFLYGAAMLHPDGKPDGTVRVAAVTVPISHLLNEDEDVSAVFYSSSFTEANLKNTKIKLAEVSDTLFEKTRKEAQADAKIVFWSELNGSVLKEDEKELLQKASSMAKEQQIYLFVSLLVKTPYVNLKENKTAAFNPNGEMILEHYKYGRSIGELCIKGDGKLSFSDTEYGRIAPLICSDMAFAASVRQTGTNRADILIVPASDWKEMTEIALRTAIVRAVENGCNVIRHTNNGQSIAADYCGNVISRSDYFRSDTKTITAQLPMGGRFTLYSHIGDVFVWLCGIYLLAMTACSIAKRRSARSSV